MKILYNNINGEIFHAVYDVDWFRFRHTTNIPLAEFNIDEVDPDNKYTCIDIINVRGKVDINGLSKYHMVDNSGWELHERDSWIEYIEDYNG